MSPLAIVDSPGLALAFAVGVYTVMLGVAAVLVRRGDPRRLTDSTNGRVGALDGLRGILALGVFVHHCLVSYVWKTTGIWALGTNPVLNQAGQSSVALFFMITGFLFTRKTMGSRFNWPAFYLGRLARLGPLYFLLVFVIFGIVMALSGGHLLESPQRVAREVVEWLLFVVFGQPDINAYPSTWIINAGVSWSLKYEALFYVLAVPGLVLLNRFAQPLIAFVSAIVLLVLLLAYHYASGQPRGDVLFTMHFLGGIVVAYAYSIPRTRALLEGKAARCFGAIAAGALLTMSDGSSAAAVVCAVVVFAAVVGGGSIFGLLKLRAAIWLGDVSYGIYLIHGLVLWLAYHLVATPASLPTFVVFALMVGTAAVLLATLSYLSLELPAMRLARKPGSTSGIRAAGRTSGGTS